MSEIKPNEKELWDILENVVDENLLDHSYVNLFCFKHTDWGREILLKWYKEGLTLHLSGVEEFKSLDTWMEHLSDEE